MTSGLFDPKGLGDRISEWRAENGVHLEELAADCGVATSTLWNVEAGGLQGVRFNTVLQIAAGMGVPLDWLAFGAEECGACAGADEGSPAVKRALLRSAHRLPADVALHDAIHRLMVECIAAQDQLEGGQISAKAIADVVHRSLTNRTDPQMEDELGAYSRLLERVQDVFTDSEAQWRALYAMYLRDRVESGMRSIEEGRFRSQEEVERFLDRWISGTGQP